MPLELVSVERVEDVPTSKAGCTRFLVVAHTLAMPSQLVRYQTLNPWLASLCERAGETGQFVQVQWQSFRFWRELVDVELIADE